MSVSASEVQHPSGCCFCSLLLAAASVSTDSHTCSEHHDGLPAFAVIKKLQQTFLPPSDALHIEWKRRGREQKVTFCQHTGQEEVCVCVWWRNAFCFNNVVVFITLCIWGTKIRWRRQFTRGGNDVTYTASLQHGSASLRCCLGNISPSKKKRLQLLLSDNTSVDRAVVTQVYINKIQREEIRSSIRSSEQSCRYGQNN